MKRKTRRSLEGIEEWRKRNAGRTRGGLEPRCKVLDRMNFMSVR